MFENKKQQLVPARVYYQRVGKYFLYSGLLMAASLALGVIGYKMTVPQFGWYDSLLNASMILGGMGPVIGSDIVLSNTAKLFASFYALFCGIAYLTTSGLLIAPIVHRFFHKLHLEHDDN